MVCMESLHCRAAPQSDWKRTESLILWDTSDKSIEKVLLHPSTQWFTQQHVDEFLPLYLERRNNTVALASYDIPDDHQMDLVMQMNNVSFGIDETHRDNFYDWYTPRFDESEHVIFEDASFAMMDQQYLKAHMLFWKLRTKHHWFVKVQYNRLVSWLSIFTTKYHDALLYANRFEVDEPILVWAYEERLDAARQIKFLLKEFALLKKRFPKYEMWKKNRWLQTHADKLRKYLQDKAFDQIDY